MIEQKKFNLSDVVIDTKFFNLLFLTAFIVFFYCTLLSAYLDGIILYSLMTLWLITALIIDSSWLIKSKAFVFYVCFYLAILFADSLITHDYSNINVMLKSQIYSFAFMLMGIFYSHNYRKFDMRPFIFILFTMLLISYVATIIGLIKYPTASRDLASGYNPLCPLFKKMGIAGFAFIYSTPYIVVTMIFFIKSNIKLMNKLILVAFICIFSYAVIQSNYTTAFLTILIAIGLGVFFVSSKNVQLKTAVLLILGILTILLLPAILRLFLNIINNKDSVIWMRINALLQALSTDGVEFNRFKLIEKSVLAFIDNPILGEFGEEIKTIGGHSDFFDCFGLYGLVGGITYNAIFISVAIYQYKLLKNKKVKICYIILQLIFLFNRVTNPILSAQNIAGSTFLICPMLLMYIDFYCLDDTNTTSVPSESNFTELNKEC